MFLENELPRFNGTDIFQVTVGTENLYTFSVKDADNNFSVTIVGGAPNGGQLVHNGEGMYTLHWMVSAIPTSSVTFRAEDARGAVVLLSPLLHVCSCFNGGTCTLDGVVRSEDSLINMTCLCTEGIYEIFITMLSTLHFSQLMVETRVPRIEMGVRKLSVLKELNVLMCLPLVLELSVDHALLDTLVMV